MRGTFCLKLQPPKKEGKKERNRLPLRQTVATGGSADLLKTGMECWCTLDSRRHLLLGRSREVKSGICQPGFRGGGVAVQQTHTNSRRKQHAWTGLLPGIPHPPYLELIYVLNMRLFIHIHYNIYIYTCMCMCMYICTCIYLHTYIYRNIHIHVHVHVHIYILYI